MPRTYTLTGTFKSDTTYHFRCEYCGQEFTAANPLEEKVEVWSMNSQPTVQQLLAEAQGRFKRRQDAILSLADKWKFAVKVKCHNCGFLPTYMINKKQIIGNIILWSIIGAGMAIPFLIPGAMADTSMLITFGLLLFVPYVLLMAFQLRRLNPNRKLTRALSKEGRSLSPPEKPRIAFGPVRRKQG